jgi:GAF domain-containing protein
MTASYDTDYRLLNSQIQALLEGETDALAITANCVGLLFNNLDDINWLGIYVARGKELVLGPFQGQPACVRIPFGKGVCGAAAATRETQLVVDVHDFPGHIACDPVSRSELVIPLVFDDHLIGVLDVDSPIVGRFSTDDQAGLELICQSFLEALPAGSKTGFI